MPLISAHRRHLGTVIVAFLVLVMVGAFLPDPVGTPRPFAPPAPAGDIAFGARIDAWTRQIRRYIRDNFGYARSMAYLRGIAEYSIGVSSDPRVYIGRHGHLYFNGDQVVGQSSGAVYRARDVGHFVAMADALQRALAASGGTLVVMMPPNSQSVGTRDLPWWWHNEGPLEYDLALRELRARGIATVDLKAGFAAMADVDELYQRTGTHWRWKGALLGFNMAMRAIGHDEWSLDPATTLGPLGPAPAEELARFIGLEDHLSDEDEALEISPPETAWTAVDVMRSAPYARGFDPYALDRQPDGVRLLVLGDSFTQHYWRPFLLHSGAARIGWMHHGVCTFDFTDVARFKPTYVILAPTEREVPCAPKNWPRGLPRPKDEP